MHSFLFTATALASIFAASYSQSIDPSSVPLSTRSAWCTSQIAQCPLICTQEANGSAATEANDCNAATLQYDCVCANGLSPNASEYSQTIPYYICTQYNTNCVASCGGGNNACAAACVQNHPCGAQSPTRVNTSTITTTMSSTTSNTGAVRSTGTDGGVVYTGFGGSSATPTSASSGSTGQSSGSSRVVAAGEVYGMGVVVVGILAGFAMLL